MGLRLTSLFIILCLKCSEQALKTSFEGISTNVAIPCSLNNFPGPLYWIIDELIYELYSVPGFIVNGLEAITIPTVDRTLDGQSFQCLTFHNSSPVDPRLGSLTTLRVFYDSSRVLSEEIGESCQKAPRETFRFDYQRFNVGTENTTIAWNVTGNCGPYTMERYESINPNLCESSSEELTRVDSYPIAADALTVTYPNTRNSLYRVSSQNCRNSLFYSSLIEENAIRYKYTLPGEMVIIPSQANQFEQVVFFNNCGQCKCPPGDEFSMCACKGNSSNISYVDSHYVFNNVVNDSLVYILHSTSIPIKCQYIKQVYHIVVQEPPLAPDVRYEESNRTFHFSSTSPLTRYHINITDITGTVQQEILPATAATQLFLASDLYPEVCGPFTILVIAENEVGQSTLPPIITNQTALSDICSCYQEKEQIEIAVSNVTGEIELRCNKLKSENYTREITVSSMMSSYTVVLHCSTTTSLRFLESVSDYTIITVFDEQECYVGTFRSEQEEFHKDSSQVESIAIYTTVSLMIVIIVLVIITLILLKSKPRWYRSYSPPKLCQTQETDV